MRSVEQKTYFWRLGSTLTVYPQLKKSILRYIRGIIPKHVTSTGAHLRDLAPEQHKNVATVASRW